MKIPRVRSFTIAMLTLLVVAFPAAAGVGIWTSLGPEGGVIGSLKVDPFDPEILYAGTYGGLFKTTDGGQTWSLISPPTVGWAYVLEIIGDAIYASFFNRGLVRSTDGGQTWSAVPGLPAGIYNVAGDPRSPNRIWAATGSKLFLSTDGGATWQARKKPVNRRLAPVTDLAVDPTNSWVYLLVTNGFFRSADQGKTWQLGTTGVKGRGYIWQVAIDPVNPSVLYLSTTEDLFRSLDRGAHWKKITPPTLSAEYIDIRDLTAFGGSVYISVLPHGLFSSSNQGSTWTKVESLDEPVALAAAPGVVYASSVGNGYPGSLFRSFDRGATWERTGNDGLLALSITTVAVDPSDSSVLYAGADSAGVLKSVDRGATWKLVQPNVPNNFLEVVVEPTHPSTIYAIAGYAWLTRSQDGGKTWQLFEPYSGFLTIALDPRKPGALWAAGYSGVLHSDDGGEHWTKVEVFEGSGMAWFEVEVDPRDARVLYVAGSEYNQAQPLRFFRSTDGGATWERRDAAGIGGQEFFGLAIDPASPSTLFAGTDIGLFRSKDSGATWTRLPGIGGQVIDVVAAPTKPTGIYAAVAGYGIKRSTDGGQTWAPARRGLSGAPIFDLAIDPQNPRRLYAGTAFRGLFAWEEPQNP